MKKLVAVALATMIVSPAFAMPTSAVSADTANTVRFEGRYVGKDPDAAVRFDLQREAPAYFGHG